MTVAFLLYGVTLTPQSACHPIALPRLGIRQKVSLQNERLRDRHWFGGEPG